MISWLTDIIGAVPGDYQFLLYITACVLIVIVVTNIINALFSPFRLFK